LLKSLKNFFKNIFSIDATNDSLSYGKYVNDSPHVHSNAVMKREVVGNTVVLCLFSTKEITSGTEIR